MKEMNRTKSNYFKKIMQLFLQFGERYRGGGVNWKPPSRMIIVSTPL